MTHSDEYMAWLECRCEVCAPICALAHDKPAYSELFDRTAHLCPRYVAYHIADYGAPPQPKQLDMFGGLS